MFFLLGSIPFWALLICVVGLELVFVNTESFGWASLMPIMFFAALGFFGDFNLWTTAMRDPWLAAGAVGAYVAVGVGWSFIKWWLVLSRYKDAYEAHKKKFLGDGYRKGQPVPADLREKWRDSLHFATNIQLPELDSNKVRIVGWVIHWPLSMIWTLLDDPFIRFCEWVYEKFSGVYRAMLDHFTADHELDTQVPTRPRSREDHLL